MIQTKLFTDAAICLVLQAVATIYIETDGPFFIRFEVSADYAYDRYRRGVTRLYRYLPDSRVAVFRYN